MRFTKRSQRGDYEEAASEYLALPLSGARRAVAHRGGSVGPVAAKTGSAGCGVDNAAAGHPERPAGAPGLAEAYAQAGFILLDDRHDAAAAYQYLVTALQQGVGTETAEEIRRRLAAIEVLQKRQVGRLRSPGW